MKKLIAVVALGLLAAACSDQDGAPSETDVAVDELRAEDTDDDTLEPEAPKVEEGEDHNEEAPHSH